MTSTNAQELLVLGPAGLDRDRLIRLIGVSGADARAADSLEMGLHLVDQRLVSGILSFYEWPEGSAQELVKALAAYDYPPPVVVVHDFAQSHEAAQAMGEGAFDFLPMPFDPTEVAACVRRTLRASEAQEMEGEVRFEAADGVLVLIFPEEMSYEDATALNNLIADGLPMPEKGAVLDLTDSRYFSSNGISSLFLLRDYYEELTERLIIAGASPQIHHVLRLAGVDRFFRFEADVDEAVAILAALPPLAFEG